MGDAPGLDLGLGEEATQRPKLADTIIGIVGDHNEGVDKRGSLRDVVLVINLFHISSEVIQRLDGLVEDGGVVRLLRGGRLLGGGQGGERDAGQRDTFEVGERHVSVVDLGACAVGVCA